MKKTIETIFITGKTLDSLGGESKNNPNGTVSFSLGSERYLLERLKGKTERYKVKEHHTVESCKHEVLFRLGYQEEVGVLGNCSNSSCGSTMKITSDYEHRGEGVFVKNA